MTGLGFFPCQTCSIYKYALMGLYKGKVQNIFTGSYMLPSADNRRTINVSKEKVRGKINIEELPEGRNMSTKIERQRICHRYVYSF
jgi:hypothetical protein